ncbi:hypothetical protein [Saccharomonospora xinjiangensis]|uniref:Glycosyltransferase RgtA/B/C/D-like domain-containing protein n=1 Tax=Saccharomonospora xinjiangensis XJ-54 TaxID=882086 RepID=I0V1X2_9PSEU|nr:hypothetical protein [Saccharomonospora xinjiangensis]EID54125.1 hypothetical protein SacxiDRAFT_1887 [Saccharomonospora xinjiangensis XJ-54]
MTAPERARTGRRRVVAQAALILGLVAVFLVGTWAAIEFTVDNAYITFRYSENLADGHGPVWNVGEDPVEGFTNFGWMLLLSVFAALDWNLDDVAKLLSALIGLATGGMLVRHGHRLGSWPAALIAGTTFVVFLPTYFHVAAGLETVAFAAVVLRATLVGLDALAGRTVRVWEPPLLVLVAGMLRPEGAFVAALPLAVWLWQRRRDRVAWFWTGLTAAVGLGYFAWRWSFYGYPLPNTFSVQFGKLDSGLRWVEDTAVVFGPLVLLTGVLLVPRATRRAATLLLAVVGATYLTYALSGPSMDYLHRFAYHAFPVLCLGAGLGVSAIATRLGGRASLQRALAAATGALTVAWAGLWGVLSGELPLIANYGVDLERTHVAIGKALADTDVPQRARSLAVHDPGAIPYFSGWRTVDYLGLNDEAVAHGADPTAVVREAEPTVIVVTASGPYVPGTVHGLRVVEATSGYEYVGKVQMRDGYWLNLFVLPEWAEPVATSVERHATYAQATYDPGRYDLTLDRWFDRLAERLGMR